jgi:hypothetical protein
MVGLDNVVLDGFAIPAALVGQHWDHTYVGSSCGLLWGCFGRSSGGSSICSAPGSSILADCLSQVGSRAGIRYGFTGVCYQASNRILYATRPQPTTVGLCRGYQVSRYTYGEYGLGPWPERLNCDPPGGGGNGMGETVMGLKFDGNEESRREVRAILSNAKLGHPIESSKFDRLSMIHSRFRSIRDDLTSRFQKGEISDKEYLTRFNLALQETMVQNEEVLGHDDFVSVFGTAGLEPEGLVDPKVFFSETGKEPPKTRVR